MKTINDLSNVLDSFDSWLSACAVVTAVRDLPAVNVHVLREIPDPGRQHSEE